ncbi:MAG: cyclic nucleotide-binding domain-containing protein [Actinomycetota bacterium]
MLLRRRLDIPTALAGTELVKAIPESELSTLLRRGTSVSIEAGAALINKDTFGREFIVVLDGTLDVLRDDVFVAEIGAGGIVGEMALLDNARRNATVVASADAQVLVFNRREFVTVLDECPVFADYVVATAEARQAA